MVRKVIPIMLCATIILCALCAPVVGATHSVYTEGNMSTTYVQYFKDILSGANINDNYVAFRSGQYQYTMVVGDLEYGNGTISLNDTGIVYTFTQSGNYNSQYKYNTNEITNFSVSAGDSIIYSDVGQFPHLVERGVHIETFILITLCGMCVFGLIERIFRHS